MQIKKTVIAALIAATAVTGVAGQSVFAKEGGLNLGLGAKINTDASAKADMNDSASVNADANMKEDSHPGVRGFLNGFVNGSLFSRHSKDDNKSDSADPRNTDGEKNDDNGNSDHKDDSFNVNAHDILDSRFVVDGMGFAVGRVTAVSGNQITASSVFGDSGKTFVANTNASTSFALRGGNAISIGNIAVGDLILIRGSLQSQSGSSYTILATNVRDWGRADALLNHKGRIAGTVTAVDSASGTFTLGTKSGGSVTVIVNGSTTVKNGTTTSTGTSAISNVAVGSKVGVKGLWNAFLNAMTAIKVRLF